MAETANGSSADGKLFVHWRSETKVEGERGRECGSCRHPGVRVLLTPVIAFGSGNGPPDLFWEIADPIPACCTRSQLP